MKSFLQYITEQQTLFSIRSPLPPYASEEAKKQREESEKHKSLFALAYSPAGGNEWGWQVAGTIANSGNQQVPMETEKAWQTDVGTAFDQDRMTGELYGNPAGFRAVAKRREAGTGYNFKQRTHDELVSTFRQNIADTVMGRPLDPDANATFVSTGPAKPKPEIKKDKSRGSAGAAGMTPVPPQF